MGRGAWRIVLHSKWKISLQPLSLLLSALGLGKKNPLPTYQLLSPNQTCVSASTENIIIAVCSHTAFPDLSSPYVLGMVLSGLWIGRCRFPVILFRHVCECCADCHGYFSDSTWLVKFIVLYQEGLTLGLLFWVLKHVGVNGCDKLLYKPVGAGSPEYTDDLSCLEEKDLGVVINSQLNRSQ